ncbi:unnamed protein product [Enterobius vermicularis]|uniref:ACB domain-containing protein n=1 Tax=Enterobius vermicularis TaxID=51028 RepID=A0A0N4V9V0_ENTVE|nr:unnamed protein product [Enterobius vermicularis]
MVYYVQLLRSIPPVGGSCNNLGDLFEAAVNVIQKLSKVSGPVKLPDERKLLFYSLYKQANFGSCTTPKPSFWNVVERYKWEAWKSLADMDQKVAKQKYVELLRNVVDRAMNDFSYALLMEDDDFDTESVLKPNFQALGYGKFDLLTSSVVLSSPVKLGLHV